MADDELLQTDIENCLAIGSLVQHVDLSSDGLKMVMADTGQKRTTPHRPIGLRSLVTNLASSDSCGLSNVITCGLSNAITSALRSTQLSLPRPRRLAAEDNQTIPEPGRTLREQALQEPLKQLPIVKDLEKEFLEEIGALSRPVARGASVFIVAKTDDDKRCFTGNGVLLSPGTVLTCLHNVLVDEGEDVSKGFFKIRCDPGMGKPVFDAKSIWIPATSNAFARRPDFAVISANTYQPPANSNGPASNSSRQLLVSSTPWDEVRLASRSFIHTKEAIEASDGKVRIQCLTSVLTVSSADAEVSCLEFAGPGQQGHSGAGVYDSQGRLLGIMKAASDIGLRRSQPITNAKALSEALAATAISSPEAARGQDDE